MKAADLTSREAVLQAIGEFDSLGRVRFLQKHGYDVARWFYVEHNGRLYDSKAIAGVALGNQHGPAYVRDRLGFTGGEASVVAALKRLEFQIEDGREASVEGRIAPKLKPGQTYTRDELGPLFGVRPNSFSVGGGMLAVKRLNVLLVVTRPGGGRSFDYGDYWDGEELVYTGKGLKGHQKFRAENRDAGENRRTKYVFEHAGTQRLTFLGIAHCVDWHRDTAPGNDGKLRRIFRFHLSFDGTQAIRRRRSRSVSRASRAQSPVTAGTPERATVRRPRRFDPARPPSSYRQSLGAVGRTPEETNALKEKAVAAHHRILMELDKAMRRDRWQEIEEVPVAVDLWGSPPSGGRVLFEAKSLSGKNELAQIRGGLAQLLEYRFLYGEPSDELCLVTDGPIDPSRARLLHALGIDFVWVDDKAMRAFGAPLSSAVAGLVPQHPSPSQ